jgi:hypothetical protein
MTQTGKTAISVLSGAVFALVALLVVLVAFSYFNKAVSQDQAGVRGPFMLASAGEDRISVWRIDQATGRVSFCIRDTQSQDPKFIATRAPFCSAWSQ